jgi:hypothetical protein
MASEGGTEGADSISATADPQADLSARELDDAWVGRAVLKAVQAAGESVGGVVVEGGEDAKSVGGSPGVHPELSGRLLAKVPRGCF